MVKNMAIIGLVLVVLGIGGSIATYSSASSKLEVHEMKKVKIDSIDALTIHVDATNIEIIESENTDEVTVQLDGKAASKAQPDFIVEQSGSELLIRVKEEHSLYLFNITVTSLTLTVHLPAKVYRSIDLNGVSSNFYIDPLTAEFVKLSTVSGDIEAGKIESIEMEIKTVSGEVEIEEVAGKSTIITQSGDITMDAYDLSDTLNVKTTSGDIYISTLTEPLDVTYDVKTVSGDIDLYSIYDANAKVGSGEILVKLKSVSGDIAMESVE